jgi:teichuronic acid biosynthesis glycosyltransferase TuaC
MKLLLITSTYPTPTRLRQGAFNETLVAALRENHRVHVIAPVPWSQVRPHPFIQLAAQPEQDYPISYYPPKLLRQCYGRFLWQSIRSTVTGLARRGFRPDAVIGYWIHPDGEAAVRAARYFDVPSLVMSGGSDLLRLPASPPRRQAVTRVLKSADRVIVVSQDLRRRAISLGANPEHVALIRRGIRRDLFYPVDRQAARRAAGLPADAIVLMWAGRLEPVKNPAMLLYAAREWHRRWGNRLQVLMYGDGSMRGELQQLRSELQLDDVVQMNPAISQTELALRYKAADLTVLTSHSEGVPNVLLESISCGVPFVATDVGGVGEIATDGLDALVGDGNIQQLVETVIQQVERSPQRLPSRQFQPPSVAAMAAECSELIKRTVIARSQHVLPMPASPIDIANATAWTEAAG